MHIICMYVYVLYCVRMCMRACMCACIHVYVLATITSKEFSLTTEYYPYLFALRT